MRWTYLGLTLLTSGCAWNTSPQPPYESVILAPRDGESGDWQVEEAQTRQFATALPGYLAERRATHPAPLAPLLPLAPLTDYVCVYRGTTFRSKRAITGHFFSRLMLEDMGLLPYWKTGEVGIDGGGTSQFEVTYLPADGTFVNFWVGADR